LILLEVGVGDDANSAVMIRKVCLTLISLFAIWAVYVVEAFLSASLHTIPKDPMLVISCLTLYRRIFNPFSRQS
jgi:hypothetical protein